MTDAYRVDFSARAVRDLERLPEKISSACVEFIAGPLAREPFRVGQPLRGRLSGRYSARRGVYRISYAIERDTRLLEVIHIDRRGDAYRP